MGMQKMKGLIGDGGLELASLDMPEPGPGEVLVEITHAGVNPADLAQVKGIYPPPPGVTDVLGLEFAGHRTDTGEAVMGLVAGGACATHIAVPEDQLLPVPGRLSLAQAATIPEALATAWTNIVWELGASEGTIYIQGGTGSVGSLAIQLARELGLEVIASAGGPARCRWVERHAVRCVDHRRDVAEQMKELVPGGLDYAINIQGADLGEMTKMMARGGAIAAIGNRAGNTTDINVGRLMVRGLTIRGTTLRSRPAAEKARVMREAGEFALPRYASGAMVPVLAEVLTDPERAHELMRRGPGIGKVVLDVQGWSRL